jgi:mRNA-degrading endonuclease toxin of MazEF toxin-antitoxin module
VHFDLTTLRRVTIAFCLCAGGAVLAGCATPAGMTVAPVAAEKGNPKYKNSIAVRNVTGGKMMNALTITQVENDVFKSALESSLAAYGYLTTGKAKYHVDVELGELDQPLIGVEFNVKSTVTYKLAGPDGAKTYPITATGTATMSDSVVGADRIRIANERAMQENIRSFLQQMSR